MMILKRIVLGLTLAIIFTSPALGQPETDYERIMLPISIGGPDGVPGAHDSIWRGFFVGHNPTDVHVGIEVGNPPPVCQTTCPPQESNARSTFSFNHGVGAVASFLYVERPGNERVKFQLRVQDVSRQALTWGTEIPVVREGDGLRGETILLDVPLDDRFRQMLRVYGLNAQNGARVWMRIYPRNGEEPVVTQLLTMTGATFLPNGGSALNPSYAEVGWFLGAFPALEGLDLVRVEIEPLEDDFLYWAFISVTNNETQHVTLITP